jgi:hypothetical protein
MAKSTTVLSTAKLKKALAIREKIEALQASIKEIFGEGTTSSIADGRKRKKSAATLAKMSAAAKARWAKKASPTATSAINGAKKKRTMSPEGRARIAAAQKARWAKAKKA